MILSDWPQVSTDGTAEVQNYRRSRYGTILKYFVAQLNLRITVDTFPPLTPPRQQRLASLSSERRARGVALLPARQQPPPLDGRPVERNFCKGRRLRIRPPRLLPGTAFALVNRGQGGSRTMDESAGEPDKTSLRTAERAGGRHCVRRAARTSRSKSSRTSRGARSRRWRETGRVAEPRHRLDGEVHLEPFRGGRSSSTTWRAARN